MLLSWSGGTLLTLFFPSFFISLIAARLVNVTVDDTLGNSQEALQILYQPAGYWSPGQNCTTCVADPDPTQVNDGTWHDNTYLPDNPASTPLSASLAFNGVALYVYCVVTRSSTNPFGNSDMTFYLDGVEVGNFTETPNGDPTYHYNVPVYVNESIPDGKHTFVLVNGRAGGQAALALLDYIVFTRSVDEADAPSSSLTSSSTTSTAHLTTPTSVAAGAHSRTSKHTVIIAGVTTAAALVFILAVVVLVYYARRSRAARPTHSAMSESYEKGRGADDGGNRLDSIPSTPQASPSSPVPLLARLPLMTRPRPSHIPDPFPLSLPRETTFPLKGSVRPPGPQWLSQEEIDRERPLPSLPDHGRTSRTGKDTPVLLIDATGDSVRVHQPSGSTLPGTESRVQDMEEGSHSEEEGLPSYTAAITADLQSFTTNLPSERI